MSSGVSYQLYGGRARRRPRRRRARLWFALVAIFLGIPLLVGIAYAGSPKRLAEGVRIAGVDVGGLTAQQATARLEAANERRFARRTVFVVEGHRFAIAPAELGVDVDWKAAVASAQEDGDGFRPLRGLRRLAMRVGGDDVAPEVRYSQSAFAAFLARAVKGVDQPAREPAIVLKGLRPRVVGGRSGTVIDRAAARRLVLAALSGPAPVGAVELPTRVAEPTVSDDDLTPVLDQVKQALSTVIPLRIDDVRWQLSPIEVAAMLDLPHDGTSRLQIGGAAAERKLAELGKLVRRAPRNARFETAGSSISVVPSLTGRKLDFDASKRDLRRAALGTTPRERIAHLSVTVTQPDKTTADLEAMGVTGLVGTYETIYGGIANRIHNVQLVAKLVDGTLVKPGGVFSFNGATGERTSAKGFVEAPVIINGELQTGLGGGVCQVSTTVFNAAYEAGLPILERTNHALYISHYPQGRDATVNYPDVDLKFKNDSSSWILVRTYVTSSTLRVSLYGQPLHRRVESETGALETAGSIPVKKQKDPTLEKGETVVEVVGAPPRRTSVHRKVYDTKGNLLYDNVWYSSYRGEYKVVRVGTKPKPKKTKKPTSKPGADQQGDTPTTTTVSSD